MSYLSRELKSLTPDMVMWRHFLHMNPETAFEEVKTAKFVAERLASFGIAVTENVSTNGVVGRLKGRRGPGLSVGLRADMDALNLAEANDFDYVSRTPGKMHACGHDGHMSMLLGAAQALAADRDFNGEVIFIFQPAEEKLAGAQAMIADGLFDRFPCDLVFGMHNWPEIPFGKAAVRTGAQMAASDVFRIAVQGKGCHAAMPHLGVDAVLVASQIVVALQAIVSRATDPSEQLVISVPVFKGGSIENVLPDKVDLAGTVRSLSASASEKAERDIRRVASSVAIAHGGTAVVEYERICPPLINAAEPAAIALRALTDVFGSENVLQSYPASMATEDFANMLRQAPGCYILAGQGSRAFSVGVHNPAYDFNDELLLAGASYWCALIDQILR